MSFHEEEDPVATIHIRSRPRFCSAASLRNKPGNGCGWRKSHRWSGVGGVGLPAPTLRERSEDSGHVAPLCAVAAHSRSYRFTIRILRSTSFRQVSKGMEQPDLSGRTFCVTVLENRAQSKQGLFLQRETPCKQTGRKEMTPLVGL